MSKKCFAVDRLINEGWFDNEKDTLAWIMERSVLINEQPILSLKEKIPLDGVIRLKKEYKRKYVNKGGLKLEKCLNDFHIDLNDVIALDCGASTGGFTDCLLKNGASLVYAVDVGYGQLAGSLIHNPHVINMEKTNLGNESLTSLIPKPNLVTLDLSYLSLKKALPICINILGSNGTVLCLVKPLFEVDSSIIRRNGQLHDREIFTDILTDLCNYFISLNLTVIGITYSGVTGNNGTLEYFIGVTMGDSIYPACNDMKNRIAQSVENSFLLHKFKKTTT